MKFFDIERTWHLDLCNKELEQKYLVVWILFPDVSWFKAFMCCLSGNILFSKVVMPLFLPFFFHFPIHPVVVFIYIGWCHREDHSFWLPFPVLSIYQLLSWHLISSGARHAF